MNIDVKKFEKLEFYSIKNAIRLHKEAVLLFQKKSYSTSFFLACVALEEIGKTHLIDDILFHYNLGEKNSEILKTYINAAFGSHATKQTWSFSNSTSELFRTHREIFEKITNKIFEEEKQN